ncbi:MAG: CoB--CoM heterodisulfide reductase iron-sulfur subunit A family protein [Ignavibacteriae bacterium]|nr:CoB--CoM heterodisulfide reductase iron-sulfur subunit A family protein [Ignavibacteriota bacterium]
MDGNGEIRVGFYICHCGSNIAGLIDVERVAAYAARLPGVVLARDYKYMCSDPGQALLEQDIREHALNRIVVASCSPLLHEQTFRNATERGGLNPFYMHMVNIREHGSWVHNDGELATGKAMDMVRAAVRRVAFHEPLERRSVNVTPAVLVVGGGIAGIHAALTIAHAGRKVYLVERDPSIGGHMAQFDKTFPTLDCAACILTPKMTAVKSHPNITLWTYSEVERVEGYVGNYRVTVKRKPRYVIEDLCVGCLECIEACIYKNGRWPDEFNMGLSKRKPVYIPFPQAVPPVPVIDPEHCVHIKTGTCKDLCVQICADREAIDFSQQAEHIDIDVGAVILATGFRAFDPKRIPYYGYGVLPNVYTALEFERIVNSSGPTGGEVVMRNGRAPERVAIVHCVGSRDEDYNRWCSRVCCMYSLKLAHLVKEKTGAEVYSFYIDMRAAGKGMEEFYNRVSSEGVHLVRGRVADITPETLPPPEDGSGRVIVQAEDTLIGRIRKIPVDMVILSTGLEPREDAEDVRRMFTISCSTGGFFLERHPKLAPVSTFTDGIYLAGACQGPKDIPDTVAQAGGAAAEALALLDAGSFELEPNTAYIDDDACSGCLSCLPLCPYTAITRDDETKKARINEALCKGCGTCVASCPSASIRQHLFEDAEILSEIDGLLSYH